MRKMLFWKQKYISRALLSYDVIFYTFQDIKDYLKNLSMRKVVSYNCKYFNEHDMKHDLKKLWGNFIIFSNRANSSYKNITVL